MANECRPRSVFDGTPLLQTDEGVEVLRLVGYSSTLTTGSTWIQKKIRSVYGQDLPQVNKRNIWFFLEDQFIGLQNLSPCTHPSPDFSNLWKNG